ncbi:hypothetical protein [Pedobacter sp. ISL-64]|uniref:hypothetical protein n=1 Tax=Pedobacter sp. ISL-64 TaxID=2819164 RepID=UPI001BE9DCF8|nr:hypothetical protein [Pedobacter sp. ISL-64]MBT2562725.1 hypothetical protein [Pedobacter sp. ISL-64]
MAGLSEPIQTGTCFSKNSRTHLISFSAFYYQTVFDSAQTDKFNAYRSPLWSLVFMLWFFGLGSVGSIVLRNLNLTGAGTERRAVKRMAGLSEPIQTGTCFSKNSRTHFISFSAFYYQTVFDSAQTDKFNVSLSALVFSLSSATIKLFSLLCLLFKKA